MSTHKTPPRTPNIYEQQVSEWGVNISSTTYTAGEILGFPSVSGLAAAGVTATARRLAARGPARSAAHIAATADVSKARNTAFFWSGIRDEEAVKIARSMGGTTLEDLNRTRGFGMPAWDPYDANVSEPWELLCQVCGKRIGHGAIHRWPRRARGQRLEPP